MKHSDISGASVFRANLVNIMSGITIVGALTGAIITRSDIATKGLFLALGASQSVIALTTARQLEEATLSHNDVVDIESQAVVNQLTESLVYKRQDYSAQLWAMTLSKLEQGESLEDIKLCLSSDKSEAEKILARLESTYGKLR